MCVFKKTCWIIPVQTFKSLSLKTAEFCRSEYPKRPLFCAIYEDFDIFPIFNFCSIWAVKKCSGAIFVYLTKSWPKDTYHSSILKILNLTFFDPVALDDLELSQGHKRLRRVLRSILDTIHAVPSSCIVLYCIVLYCTVKTLSIKNGFLSVESRLTDKTC